MASLVILLLIPMLKEHAPLLNKGFNERELKGYFEPIERPELSLKNLWSSDFQNNRDEILKRDLGIRPLAFRVNNQLHHSILKEIRTNYVEGKDSYFFGKDYIEDYMGFRYVGEDKVKYETIRLKYVKDKLKEFYDVEMIVIIAPSKAYVFEDKLPSQYDLSQKTTGNYEAYLEALNKLDIEVLDFNKYLTKQVKETGEKDHILMPKYGIHWSQYAGTLAADSLNNHIGLLKNREVVRMNTGKIVKTTKSRNQDEDIGESMNLLYPLESQNYSYFEGSVTDTIGKYRPSIVLTADSFGWTFWNKKIPQSLWGKESLFLYYYYELWSPDRKIHEKTQKENLLSYAEKIDAFVLMQTPMTMKNWGNGFIDRMYEVLKEKEALGREK